MRNKDESLNLALKRSHSLFKTEHLCNLACRNKARLVKAQNLPLLSPCHRNKGGINLPESQQEASYW